MTFNNTFVASSILALVFLLSVPHVTSAATGRGLFKDMYCAVLSLVNKECEQEIDGIKVKVRADAGASFRERAQAAVSDAFSRAFGN